MRFFYFKTIIFERQLKFKMSKQSLRIFCVSILLTIGISSKSQTITSVKGYSKQIGVTVAMLEELKKRVTGCVSELELEEVDFLLDDDANRIGALIMHLAATEKYYQLYTFENRKFNEAEKEKWQIGLKLGDDARKKIINQPIKYYLEIWNEVRKETLRLLKTKNDKWFNSYVKESKMNNHWAWYHVMEHQANHMGQIKLITKRLPKD